MTQFTYFTVKRKKLFKRNPYSFKMPAMRVPFSKKLNNKSDET